MQQLHFLYEDEYLVFIDKQAGVLSVPDRFEPNKPNLSSILRKKFPELHVVHRLDRDTSGVMVFAKNAEIHAALSQAFEGREVEKYYLAIVNGTPPETGTIDAPLAESLGKPGTMTVTKKGKESLTTYQLKQAYGMCSLLEVRIFTGRMHQVRVHLAYEGYPLFIDPVYGSRDAFYLSEIKGRRYRLSSELESEKPLIDRHTLHSHRLVINHPVSNQKLEVESHLPKDMKALINQIQKMKF
jgi:23S rRNA pseudouridine1911/1915/1917 synthase